MAQPISTNGGPPAWAVDKKAELGRPSRKENGWTTVCKSGPRLYSFTEYKFDQLKVDIYNIFLDLHVVSF